ncbi:unnamed protein product [Linum trigynum]|uniref:Uncharacterized protein n=1 Tax=Linum trigynum TaxID=586398 RepID=A0AAV2E7P6_9ROSI
MLHGILPLRPVEAIVGAVAPLEDLIGAEGILPLPQNHEVAEREPFQAAPARDQAYRQAKLEEDAIEDCKRKKQSQLGDYLEMDVDTRAVTVESFLSPNMVDGNGGLLAEKEYIPIVTPGSTVKEPGLFNSELQGVSNKHMEVAGYVYDEGSWVHSWMLMHCQRYSCPRVKFKQGDTCINCKESYVEALGANAVGDCFSSDNGATETQVQQNLIHDDTDVLPVDSLEYRSSYGVVFSDGSLIYFPDTGGNDFVIGRPFPTQPALLFIHYSEGLIPGKGDCILLKFHRYWCPRVKIKRSDVFSNFKEPYNDLGSRAVVGFDAELLLLRSKLLSRRGGQNACVGVVAEAIFSGDYERYSVGVSKMDKGFFAYVNEIGSLDHSWVLVSSHGLWCPRVQLKRKATFLASLKVHATIITSSAAVPLREDDTSNTFSIYGLEKHGIGRGIGLLMAQGKVQQVVFMIGLEDAVDLQHVNGDRMIGGRFDSCLVLGESQGRGIGFDFKEPYKDFGWAMVLSYGRECLLMFQEGKAQEDDIKSRREATWKYLEDIAGKVLVSPRTSAKLMASS